MEAAIDMAESGHLVTLEKSNGKGLRFEKATEKSCVLSLLEII